MQSTLTQEVAPTQLRLHRRTDTRSTIKPTRTKIRQLQWPRFVAQISPALLEDPGACNSRRAQTPTPNTHRSLDPPQAPPTAGGPREFVRSSITSPRSVVPDDIADEMVTQRIGVAAAEAARLINLQPP